MDIELRDKFIERWKKYFGKAELPITFYYTLSDTAAEWADKPKGWSCIICELAKVRKGRSMMYNAERISVAAGSDIWGIPIRCVPVLNISFVWQRKHGRRTVPANT